FAIKRRKEQRKEVVVPCLQESMIASSPLRKIIWLKICILITKKKMENKRISGNDLLALGYKENHAMGVALKINKKRLGFSREQILDIFKYVVHHPDSYITDYIFKPLSEILLKIDTIEK